MFPPGAPSLPWRWAQLWPVGRPRQQSLGLGGPAVIGNRISGTWVVHVSESRDADRFAEAATTAMKEGVAPPPQEKSRDSGYDKVRTGDTRFGQRC